MITEKDFLDKFNRDPNVTEIMDDGSIDGDSILVQAMYRSWIWCNLYIYTKEDKVEYDCYIFDDEDEEEIASVKKTVSPITLESFDECIKEIEDQLKAKGIDLNKFFSTRAADSLNNFFDTIGSMLGLRDFVYNDDYFKELVDTVGPDMADQVKEIVDDTGYIRLKNSDDKDAFRYLDRIIEDCHYDNGEPLCCDDWTYWEHYDRDQDYWGFFEEFDIDHFEMEKGHLVAVIDLTLPELVKVVHNEYDGASWEHDFGDRTPDEVRA